MPGDVLVDGRVDEVRCRARAAAMGTDPGIAYRWGPSAVELGYPAMTMTYGKRPDKRYDPISVRLGWSNRSCMAPGRTALRAIAVTVEEAEPGAFEWVLLEQAQTGRR